MIGQPPRSTPLPHPTLSRSISVTISHDAPPPQVVPDTATITDPNVVATGGNSYTVQEGSATLTNVVVASFTDPGNPTGGTEEDRKSAAYGKRGDLGGRRVTKKKNNKDTAAVTPRNTNNRD